MDRAIDIEGSSQYRIATAFNALPSKARLDEVSRERKGYIATAGERTNIFLEAVQQNSADT
jgi:hypothetical protein